MQLQITCGSSFSAVIEARNSWELWLGYVGKAGVMPIMEPGFSEDNVATYRTLYIGRFFIALTVMKPRHQRA